MADFREYWDKLSEAEDLGPDKLFRDLKTKTVKKGEYLLKSGQTCRHLFFINEGLLKMVLDKREKELIMRFFSENVLFTAFESYLTKQSSNHSIVALEDTKVTLIPQKQMEELCLQHHQMETFFRKLVSLGAVKMTKRIGEMLEENATERYNQFLRENKNIVQRISLGDLAQYLGITQQSLSRIRARK
jgi:CRP-like cAMP-binding protein